MFLSFLQEKFYHNTVQDWLIALGIIAATLLLARFVYWGIRTFFRRFTKNTDTELDDLIIRRIDTPVMFGIVLIGIRFAIEHLHFPKTIESYLQRGFVFMGALTVTWFVTRVIRVGIEFYFQQLRDAGNQRISQEMITLGKRASLLILWPLGIIVGLNNAGFDVGALIAGLGIGGLAVALAAQDTVKNVIGGIVVFIDKPFSIGDIIRIKEYEGTVVYTGIRSTRLRTYAGRLVTIPNAHFTDSVIENISLEPSRRISQRIMLASRGENTIAIQNLIRDLRETITTDPDIDPTPPVIFLERISPAPEIQLLYYIREGKNYPEVQNRIHLRMLELIHRHQLTLLLPETSSSAE
ncbi:MAG: mechanosensitive ion channel family protein [Chitinophagales bacterium]|nr:mechanosensitive ion channel family protein [Chitinophagales bacterium]MDW8419643.1 mechanosensitive ion channel family protein [Chitinophagales bacterium]